LNAPSIVNIFKEIVSQINAIKDDPFNPNGAERIKSSILEKYTGKIFFIPMGDGGGAQKLTHLFYNTEEAKITFYPFGDFEQNLSYYYRVDSDSCGAVKYRGYSVYSSQALKNTSSDFGSSDSSNSNSGRSYSVINIKYIPVEQARSLSGQIERYVTFKKITSAYSQSDYSWTKGSSCSDIYIMNQLSGTYEYNFRDKNTGKSLLRFETQDN
jgi:hypothetical protein